MQRRNWLELSRKLVDQYDLDYTVNAIAAAMDENTLAYYGEGVFISTTYPLPFPITMSGVALGGSVGNGIAFDINGQITRIDSSSPTAKTFTLTAANPSNPRWDLLVIRYAQAGDTPVPKPSDPITTVDLNLHDDFELAVVAGTPSGSPAYPAKGVNDIILAGLQVPAAATLGTQVTVDLSIREMAQTGRAAQASFVHEFLGTGDGVTTTFSLSQTPLNASSLLMLIDEVAENPAGYSLAGQDVTFTTAPALGEDVGAYYVADDPASQNPLSGAYEALGTGDGTTALFNMSGKAANQGSTLVLIDGAFYSPVKWNLVQGASIDQVQFNSGYEPGPGQDVAVFYLVNANTVGLAPVNNSAWAVFGSPSSPLIIDPTISVPVSADGMQLRFVKSNGGAGVLSGTPSIAPGIFIGQEVRFIGCDDTDSIQIDDGNGVAQNGTIVLKQYANITYQWDSANWCAVAREF